MLSVVARWFEGRVFGAIYALLLAVVLIGGYLAQSSTYLNHDVSWVLYSSRFLLSGATFGKDIVAANPPLIWWVSTIPNALATSLDIPVILTFRLFVMALIMACLWSCDRLLILSGAHMILRALFGLTCAYFLTISVGRDFGQREQLSLLLMLPYMLAVAVRLEHRSIAPAAGVVIGIASGIGAAFKPHFLLVPVLLESALLWQTRSLRLLIRPEIIGAVSAVAAYILAVILLARPWLIGALPDIARVYWAFEQPIAGMLVPLLIRFGPLALVVLAALWRQPNSLVLALFLAAVGFFGAAVAQGKYYSYHLYPAFALLVVALAVACATAKGRWWWPTAIAVLFAVVIGRNGVEAAAGLQARTAAGEVGSEIVQVSAFVDKVVPPAGAFLAISTHPFPGFPTALYADRKWASVSNSRLFLPAVVRLRVARSGADVELLHFAERKEWDAMVRDLSKQPVLVLVDNRTVRHAIGTTKFNYLDFYLEDPRFRQMWASYRHVDNSPAGFDAYLRERGQAR